MELLRDSLRRKRRVIVDETPIEVDAETTSSDLIRASGRNPTTYSLITTDHRGGYQLIPSGRQITVRNNQRFETNLTGRGG